MQKGLDLSSIYQLRNNYTIIGLTGRTGSGYKEIAKQLTKGFNMEDYPKPDIFDLSHNSYKKYKIAYNYAAQNFHPFTLIKYRDIISLFLTKYPYEKFASFLKTNDDLKSACSKFKLKAESNFETELQALSDLKPIYDEIHKSFSSIDYENELSKADWVPKLNKLFQSEKFQEFSNMFHSVLQKTSYVKHNLLMELLTTNIRKCGDPFESNKIDPNSLFSIVKLINSIIKAIRKSNENRPTKIIIDSFRVPLEIMYFKQRYSAFYVITVNRENDPREKELEKGYGAEYENVKKILEMEYSGGKGKGFYRQYVRDCIEKADIHISFRDLIETKELNDSLDEKRKKGKDSTSPYYSWPMQLIKYIALIEHPGLVTPSPEERCMQLAYTAKYNSGCISRQVGAAISDEHYSIKAIGWNNTPSGQVPCIIRDAKVLLESSEDKKDNNSNNFEIELSAFTPYEKNNLKFKSALKSHYNDAIKSNEHLLKGRNVCFCFKSLQNSCSEGKNQVHTRALHAEESAFLQITKYGGTAINGGKLFTTASPCELCAKKAYQLGIKVIYYIDPYPGISTEQILTAGTNPPELRLFNGAIGNAYHWLYEPFMAYKDELSLILGLDIKDKLSQLEDEISTKDLEIEKLQNKLSELTAGKKM